MIYDYLSLISPTQSGTNANQRHLDAIKEKLLCCTKIMHPFGISIFNVIKNGYKLSVKAPVAVMHYFDLQQ